MSGNGHSQDARRILLLAILAGMSSLLYWLAFTRVYNLSELIDRPLFDLYDYSQIHPHARWWLAGAFLILGGLYWAGWRTARQVRGRTAWAIVLGGAIVSSLVLLFMYPIGATDIFDYIMHGRILSIHQANPFHSVPRDFGQDPFLAYAGWKDHPSAYGPFWTLLNGGVARLAGDGILSNVLAFKLLCGLFFFAGIAVVAAILRRQVPDFALAGVLVLAWNPLVLYETLGNGHNDIAMAFWMLVAVLFMTRRRYTLTVVALVTGALFKFTPILLLPAAGFIALRRLSTSRERVRFVMGAAAAGAILPALAYLPFWRGAQVLTVFQNVDLFTTSLPAFLVAWLQPRWGQELAGAVIGPAAVLLAGLFALWQGYRAHKSDSWEAFPRAAFRIVLFYLLFTAVWFQEWYTIWPVALAALLPWSRAVPLALLVNYAGLTKPLIFVPLWLWQQPLPPKTWRELRLGPAVLALPWMVLLIRFWATRIGVLRGRPSGEE